ncbi:hypothetical protein QTP88_018898 [Uroleucon formosanum]
MLGELRNRRSGIRLKAPTCISECVGVSEIPKLGSFCYEVSICRVVFTVCDFGKTPSRTPLRRSPFHSFQCECVRRFVCFCRRDTAIVLSRQYLLITCSVFDNVPLLLFWLLSDMGNEDPKQLPHTTPTVIKTPSYQDIFDLATSLQARLITLEGQQNNAPNTTSVTNPTATQNVPICADFCFCPISIARGRSSPGMRQVLRLMIGWFVKSNLTTSPKIAPATKPSIVVQQTNNYRHGTEIGTTPSEVHQGASDVMTGPVVHPPPQFGVTIVAERAT